MKGTVFGGQQPVANSTITVYEVGTSGYGSGAKSLTTATTDSNGSFSIPNGAYSCDYANAPLYITAEGGDAGGGSNPAIAMMSTLGPCSGAPSQTVVINEVSTAATVFALAQFIEPSFSSPAVTIGGPTQGQPSGTFTRGLVAAMNNTVPALLNVASGQAKGSTTSGTVTTLTEATKINTIANVLAACINSNPQSSNVCSQLFSNTTPPGSSSAPVTTLQAALMMALYPYQNVTTLYNLATATPPFVGLAQAPNDWTVAIAYKNTALGVGVNGNNGPTTSMSMDIDADGRPWFPSTMPGAVGVAYFDPQSQTFNGPYNATSNGVTHPQYVAIDRDGMVWANDQNGANLVGVAYSSPGTVQTLSIPGATGEGALLVDGNNSIDVAYRASNGLNVETFPSPRTTSPTSATLSTAPNGAIMTGLNDEGPVNPTTSYMGAMVDASGSPCSFWDISGNWFNVESAGSSNCSSGLSATSLVALGNTPTEFGVGAVTSTNQLCDDYTPTCTTPAVGLNAPEGIATDGNNQLWVANSGNGSVSTMGNVNGYAKTATVPYLHNSSNGGTMTNPFALAIDASGNVWTVSPGCVDTTITPCTPGPMVLTQIVGAAGPSTTPLSQALYYSGIASTGGSTANSLGTKPTF